MAFPQAKANRDGRSGRCYLCAALARYGERECEACGSTFVPLDKGSRFCSTKCANAPRRKPSKKCDQCGVEYRPKSNGKRYRQQRFCSFDCAQSYGREHPEIYPTFKGGIFPYYGPNWREQARLARARDAYTCQDCGKEQRRPALSVHHTKPRRLFGDDYRAANCLDNLVTLCKKCHKVREWRELDQWAAELAVAPVPIAWLGPGRRTRPWTDRFWEKVAKTSGCWDWTATCNRSGFATFKIGEKTRNANAIAYELLVGPIPEGKTVYQHCENRRCVNPAHAKVAERHPNSTRRQAVA